MRKFLKIDIPLWSLIPWIISGVILLLLWRGSVKKCTQLTEDYAALVEETAKLHEEFAARATQIRDTLLVTQRLLDSLEYEHHILEYQYEQSQQAYQSVGYRPDNTSDYYKSSWTRIISTRPDTDPE